MFAAVYKKPMKGYTEVEETILTLLRNEGPMNLKMMKEITGILNKDLSKAAQRLQKAFILYEDQLDMDNERAWYLLEDEFDHLDFRAWTEETGLEEIIRRFLKLNVAGDVDMVRSYTGLPAKKIKAAVARMMSEGITQPVLIDGKSWVMLKEDVDEVSEVKAAVPDKLYLLDGNDHIVKSRSIELTNRFGKSQYKTIRWIMLKGEIIGRLLGWFRFGPPDLEDVQVDEPLMEDPSVRSRIVEAVEACFEGQATVLKRYMNEPI